MKKIQSADVYNPRKLFIYAIAERGGFTDECSSHGGGDDEDYYDRAIEATDFSLPLRARRASESSMDREGFFYEGCCRPKQSLSDRLADMELQHATMLRIEDSKYYIAPSLHVP